MNKDDSPSVSARWARLRFAVVGRLLASPPKRGELRAELERLSKELWRHPTTGELVRFGRSTIERWYYAAKQEARDPVSALRRKERKDFGAVRSLNDAIRRAIRSQYEEHAGWSYKLHYDNIKVLAEEEEELGSAASYNTVRRYMQSCGLTKVRSRSGRKGEAGKRAARRREKLEVRSFEATHVHGLWHLDFHEGSRRILTEAGEWVTPQLFGVLDDRSRLCCHLQWYLHETAEVLVHGLSQAIQKRALPRRLMTDNGSAMIAAETVAGLEEFSITHETTLVESPHQNGKQESFWGQIEGRLIPMLEGVAELKLDSLNEATQAWVEGEYNRTRHDEIGCPPLQRYLQGPEVGREGPSSEELRRAFRKREWRTQRRSDGTVSIEGCRYEVPSRFRQQNKLLVRYARWDLSRIDIVDPRSGAILSPLYPLDKEKNADGRRRRLEPTEVPVREAAPPSGEMAPLLKKLIREYAATGLPPAYLPKRENPDSEE